MTKLKFLAATAAIVGMAGSASAADVYQQGGSMKDVPYVAPLPTWDGFYIGVGGGMDVVTHDWDHDGIFDGTGAGFGLFPLFDGDSDVGRVSGFGTVQIGFDRQVWGGSWVGGLFADYDWMNLDSDLDNNTVEVGSALIPGIGTLDGSLSVEVDNMWSIGGRIGYLTSPNTLIYGLLAYTQADVTAFGNLTLFDGAGGVAGSVTDKADIDASGFTVGAGIETKVTENVSLKFEYRFTDLDNDTMNGTDFISPTVFAVSGGELDLDTEIHSVRALLVWRTDWLSGGLGF